MGAATPEEGLAGPISVFFEVLPTSIQAIIPPIPSLRRTVSQRKLRPSAFLPGALFVLQPQTDLPPDERLGSGSSSDDLGLVEEVETTTPPVEKERPSSQASSIMPFGDTRRAVSRQSSIEEFNSTSVTSSPQQSRVKRMNLQFFRRSPPAPAPPAGPASGIDRKFQRKGQDLLRDSEAEADPANQDPNPSFERRAYLDGVAYLLQGLPRDLDDSEISIIRGSLPNPLRQDLDSAKSQQMALTGVPQSSAAIMGQPYGPNGMRAITAGPSAAPYSTRRSGPSVIHRLVQTVITLVVFLVRLFASVCYQVAHTAIRFGNEYQIPEKVLSQGLFMFGSFASMSTMAASKIGSVSKASYRVVDDKVPNGLGHVLQWVADETLAGAFDGVRDGLKVQVAPMQRADVVQPALIQQ